ncbi:MAG: phosphoglycerate mutase family protein [Anaerolineae bacterium]|nr:phosphoglycerate mutase family protein [Anaerolineae bacterium]
MSDSRQLILIRHSISAQQPEISSHHWTLTAEGEARCLKLAERIAAYQPVVMITSEEPKARLTGAIVARQLDISTETEHDLHEHLRRSEPYSDAATFRSRIETLLTQPDTLVFGEETGAAACQRFTHAVDRSLKRHPAGTIALASHGTVLSLYLAQVAGIDPVAYWSSIGMPAYIVLSLPGGQVLAREDVIP